LGPVARVREEAFQLLADDLVKEGLLRLVALALGHEVPGRDLRREVRRLSVYSKLTGAACSGCPLPSDVIHLIDNERKQGVRRTWGRELVSGGVRVNSPQRGFTITPRRGRGADSQPDLPVPSPS